MMRISILAGGRLPRKQMSPKKKKFVPPPELGPWKELLAKGCACGVVEDFRETLGGDERFLQYLWERYAGLSSSGPSVVSHDEWAEVRRLSERLCEALHKPSLDSLAHEDNRQYANVLISANFIRAFAQRQARTRPRPGKPLQSHARHYWCAALLPYLDLLATRGDRWLWMARWLHLLGCGIHPLHDSSDVRESLRKWWETRAVRPMLRMVPRVRAKKGGTSTSKSNWPPFEAAFEYLYWKELRWDSEEAKAYRRLVYRSMPFLDALGW